jgi:hypothetical protein
MRTRTYHSHNASDHETDSAGMRPVHGNCNWKSGRRMGIGQCGSMSPVVPANCMHIRWQLSRVLGP